MKKKIPVFISFSLIRTHLSYLIMSTSYSSVLEHERFVSNQLIFNPNKAGLFEVSFSFGVGGGNLILSSDFKKNLSNINITLYNC